MYVLINFKVYFFFSCVENLCFLFCSPFERRKEDEAKPDVERMDPGSENRGRTVV